MSPPVALDWQHPLDLLGKLPAGADFALLYSGMRSSFSGRYSILGIDPAETLAGDDFTELERRLTEKEKPFENAWMGYFGYGMKHAVEALPADAPSHIALPASRWVRYASWLVFDHDQATLTLHGRFPELKVEVEANDTEVSALASDLHRQEYFAHVQTVLDAIDAGDLYQANLTRKFFGEFESAPCPVRLFRRLVRFSPAPYSALIKTGDSAIISSSPEQFLHITPEGMVETRPIKGSARRSPDPEEDDLIRNTLAASEKDRAENLMIVDLMRNDLSRSCVTGSVEVSALYQVNSYATVHHMSSTITGQRKAEVSPLELVARCFPPGSMTGAPKIRAIELCSRLEPRARGVYSGALGWFGGDGSVDLSVVIRTLIVQGKRFEFQVGGAIVHGSTPEGEWEETLVKARGLALALGIDEERLRRI